MVARFGGIWDRSNYIGGYKRPFTLPMESNYEDLVSKVCEVLHINRTIFEIRINFVATNATAEIFEINDNNGFDFMKIDDSHMKWLNVEIVELNNVPP